jgi:hypothetical protein
MRTRKKPYISPLAAQYARKLNALSHQMFGRPCKTLRKDQRQKLALAIRQLGIIPRYQETHRTTKSSTCGRLRTVILTLKHLSSSRGVITTRVSLHRSKRLRDRLRVPTFDRRD